MPSVPWSWGMRRPPLPAFRHPEGGGVGTSSGWATLSQRSWLAVSDRVIVQTL